MMNKRPFEKIKAFGMTNQMVTEDLSRIEQTYGVELGHIPTTAQTVDDVYYGQFDAAIRLEAAQMSRHYEVFYSLEKSIRQLVSEVMATTEGNKDWWSSGRIPPAIVSEVTSRMQKEIDAGVTQRSEDELDYTTFGELSQIITTNWAIFDQLFNSKGALQKILFNLNTLRNAIAHCSPLAEDEQVRLKLSVKDWFRNMS